MNFNFDAALKLVDTFGTLFGSKGVLALNLIHKIIHAGKDLPKPFDKFNPFLQEVDAVLELFIEMDKMELPPAE